MKASVLLRRLCWALLGLALIFASIPPSQARMGGGHSYSGGSSGRSSSSGGWGGSSSHSSGGGGGSFHWSIPSSGSSSHGVYVPSGSSPSAGGEGSFTVLVEIIILILVIYVLYRLLAGSPTYGRAKTFQSDGLQDWNRMDAAKPFQPGGAAPQLASLQARDENFSKVLFLDFASLLYHKFYTFRGTGQFKLLAPYLSKAIIEQTTGNAIYAQQRIHGIVIGQARIVNASADGQADSIVVEFESNMTLRYPTAEEARFACQEQWTFSRQAGVLSPQPEQMRNLSCPACGAPANFTDAGECPYCHTFIQAGEKQWQVLRMRVLSREPFQTESPGGYVEEAGTDLPTLKQATLQTQQQQFLQNHGMADWGKFFEDFGERVVKPYFLATYAAWSQGDWRKARHLVSDRLYESNNFWMEEYARQGWQNRLENIQIQNIIPARIDLDKFYESLTVRVFASCLDYTVDKQGKAIGGSPKKPRRFSEYWTFIRTAGADHVSAGYDLKTCPSCGAPADKIGQAGECGYCGSKLSEGRFSWVLAIITQDDAYEG